MYKLEIENIVDGLLMVALAPVGGVVVRAVRV